MAANRASGRLSRSRFRAGDLIRVRSAGEIAATLDADGTLDGLPFMPEMARFCGRTFKVRASAHKTCSERGGMRRIGSAAFLEGVRCDGSAHGGCQARCSLFWKDAWLEDAGGVDAHGPSDSPSELERKAARSVFLHGRSSASGTYACQSTELLEAAGPLPFWSVRQYWDDVRSGNVSLGTVVRGLPVIAFNKFQYFSRRLPPRLRIRGGRLYPDVVGTLVKTPDAKLGIEPGELVEIRSQVEILGTVDAAGRNRGLSFYLDMVPYCGSRAAVRHRVETRIDEGTGELRHLRSPCLVLDRVVCRGGYKRFCPRANDCYWREAWLRRVDAPTEAGRG